MSAHTNDPASQAPLIGQSPVSEVQEAPADGGWALFYSALVSDGSLVSHHDAMVSSLLREGLIALLVETCVDGRRGACVWHALGNRESGALDKIGM